MPLARAPGSATAGARRRARLRSPTTRPQERGRDYLHEELAERLRDAPAEFELLFQIAAEGDPIDDPTAIWPDDRELVVAGRLEITEIVDDPESDGHIDVFDPIRVVDGIELSNDPILHARARAYSVSAYRRMGVEVGEPVDPADARRVARLERERRPRARDQDPPRGHHRTTRAVSSVGRAPRLHRGGRWFEPRHRPFLPAGRPGSSLVFDQGYGDFTLG